MKQAPIRFVNSIAYLFGQKKTEIRIAQSLTVPIGKHYS
jgi:hypothetical protein